MEHSAMNIQVNANRQRNLAGERRKGTAMTEFAIVAPLLFLLFFASFEFCRVAMIRHTADNAVYEGCRMAILPGATSGEAEAEARRVMGTLGANRVTVAVSPSTITRTTEEVSVRVEVPLDENSFVPNQFVAGRTIVRELTMRREGR
jgi:Flp pilus assembly protein TadG